VVTNYFGGVVPPNSGSINNNSVVGNAINPVFYKGARVSGLWKINDDWNALITQSYQSIDADGVFWQEQYDGLGHPLPDLSVQLYNPSYNHDKFEDTQLTITGRIGQLKLVYTGGYLDRNVTQVQDYTNYSRGTYAGYYQCKYPGYPFAYNAAVNKILPTTNSPGYCYSPSEFWTDRQNSTHQSHELRLSTPDDWRIRAIGGLFWENYTIHEQADWHYGTSPIFQPVAAAAGCDVQQSQRAAVRRYVLRRHHPGLQTKGGLRFGRCRLGPKEVDAHASVRATTASRILRRVRTSAASAVRSMVLTPAPCRRTPVPCPSRLATT